MLVLTRKPGEQIVIAGNIRLTVVSVGPGRVKIGIEAPESVKIDRQEVFERKQLETEPAAAVGPAPVAEAPAGLLHNRIAHQLPQVPPPSRLAVARRLPRKPR